MDGVGGVLVEVKEEAEEPQQREESLLKRGTSKMSRALVRQPHTQQFYHVISLSFQDTLRLFKDGKGRYKTKGEKNKPV